MSVCVKGLDDISILKTILDGERLPVKNLDDYTPDELRELVPYILDAFRSVILGKAGIPGDIQEALDVMNFKAGKDSKTSSMRPSSDFYGNRTSTPKDEPEHTDADEEPTSSSTSEATDAEQAEAENCEDQDAESEKNLRKDRGRSRRIASGKKPGKQSGAPGAGFHEPLHVDSCTEEIVMSEKCKACPKFEECKGFASTGKARNVYDVSFTITKTVYKEASVQCPDDGEELKAEMPEYVTGTNQYGTNIMTIVCMLYCVGMVSLGRIQAIVAPMLGLQLSPATILKYVHCLAVAVQATVEAILDAERNEKVVHCDETGAKVNGKLHWIHCVSTELYTFVSIQAKRGKEGMDVIGFLTTYVGTVVHDCWSSYFQYDSCLHAICNIHIERDLSGLSKFFHNASLWADDMLKLLTEMLQAKHDAMAENLRELSPNQLAGFSQRFDQLIEKGKEVHPLPERKKGQRGKLPCGRARALVNRMEVRKAEIFRFLTDFDVPYTNNCAEQSFRMLGVKRNTGIFRTLDGAKDFCAIWSYLSTARKHHVSYYVAVKRAFRGESYDVIFPKNTSVAEPRNSLEQAI